MATESDLRDLLQGPDPEGRAAIDLDAVLTRTRRRRRPKVVLAQALGSVAAVGVLVTGVAVTLPQLAPASLMVADEAAGGSEELASVPEDADESLLRLPAETCGVPYVDPGPASGWSLELAPAAADGEAPLTVPVTLRNVGEASASAVASPPRVVVTQAGVVVGYAPAVDAVGIPVDLEAGAATTLDAVVEPFACDPANPMAEAADLPVLSPGAYEMRPVLILSDDTGLLSTVVGGPQPLVIG